ncbi:hypothetical protein [Natrinema sp. 1APR25-10V2]|uniref:hypothetical protein n=1 Tax=Natrinema sp. 1APR25-10V2 TaxID=2951081 RepID=UPI002875A869|nr:hypothetical protein [Natrinema sp. 1APR25-10V2]MDS0475241.1 hypothetical protein [Natrinema sp. 1APR25-10V2]
MAARRTKMGIGVAMVAVGLVQAGLYASRGDWFPTALGVFYAALGVGYLRVEVYGTE